MTGTREARMRRLMSRMASDSPPAPREALLGFSGLVVGVLNSFDEFAVPALAPLAWNLAIILTLIFLTPKFHGENRIYAYAIGVLIGTVVQLCLPLPWLRRTGFRIVRSFDWRDPRVIRVMKLMLPEIVDINMPAEGVFHNLVIVSIRKRYPGQARKVMTALWGMGLMMLAKTIVVVSEHVNVHDLSEVAWRTTGNIDPKRDLMILEGPMDDLDHAAVRHRYGGKLGIDATEKGPMDELGQTWPDEIRMSDEMRERVTRRWKDYGL
jgi:hypothetical protein